VLDWFGGAASASGWAAGFTVIALGSAAAALAVWWVPDVITQHKGDGNIDASAAIGSRDSTSVTAFASIDRSLLVPSTLSARRNYRFVSRRGGGRRE